MKNTFKNHKESYIPFKFKKGSFNLDLKEEISEKIIEARIARGISQEELAKKIGTKQPSIARLESGKYSPNVSFLEKIAKALDTELIPPKFKFLEKEIDQTEDTEIKNPFYFPYFYTKSPNSLPNCVSDSSEQKYHAN